MARTTVTLHKNGDYWQLKYRDRQGKQRSRGLGNRLKVTARAAKLRARNFEADLNYGLIRSDKAPTLQEHIDRFLAHRAGMAETTLKLYDHTSRQLVEFFGPNQRIDNITRADANDWRVWIAGKSSAAENTIRRKIREVKCIFKAAVDEDILQSNPFSKLVGSTITMDKAWVYIDRHTLRKMQDCCPSDGWRILLGLCRLAGLRRGEAMLLRWVDVDLDSRRITANAQVTQRTTKKRRRELPIDPELYDMLFEVWMQGSRSELVIPRDSTPLPNGLLKGIKTICEKAGVPNYSKPFHTLRKNCETDWLEKCPVFDVCSWLGHDPSVAAKHYHKTKDEMYEAISGKNVTDENVPKSVPKEETS